MTNLTQGQSAVLDKLMAGRASGRPVFLTGDEIPHFLSRAVAERLDGKVDPVSPAPPARAESPRPLYLTEGHSAASLR